MIMGSIDEQLVHHISKFPVLYDKKNETYKLHTKKEMIWIDIAKILNTEGKFI